jgi:hypothetical protein
VNGKKPKYVTKSKIAQTLFTLASCLAITTIFNANLLTISLIKDIFDIFKPMTHCNTFCGDSERESVTEGTRAAASISLATQFNPYLRKRLINFPNV